MYVATTDWAMEEYKCWHLPIFPGRRQPSIFGTTELNFCVRYGNRWTLSVINTNFYCRFQSETYVNKLSINIISYSLFTIHYSLSVRRTRFWWLVGESTKSFALDGSHHRCSPLWAKNSPQDCFLYAQTLAGSIPQNRIYISKSSFSDVFYHLVTRGGIEPPLPAWEAGVLTAWPTSHI